MVFVVDGFAKCLSHHVFGLAVSGFTSVGDEIVAVLLQSLNRRVP
jgi:hypothetical protein